MAALTQQGDIVLDPMMGSGTTVLEAYLLERQAVGFDIDPLALLLSRVKVTPLDIERLMQLGYGLIKQARYMTNHDKTALEAGLLQRWDAKTKEFIDYWFAHETQIELLALMVEIEKIAGQAIRAFFELTFSTTIITKTGGVSMAFDLAHTRPHRAKVVTSRSGEIVLGNKIEAGPLSRQDFQAKTLRSPLDEFEKRFQQNVKGLLQLGAHRFKPETKYGDAQALPLEGKSVDLIVTSPPYASNAIDYMRAHKFSLVWMGHAIDDLSTRRSKYIGGEAGTDIEIENFPPQTAAIVDEVTALDRKKGVALRRYYSEMTRVLGEMFRVLKCEGTSIVVVGSSVLRGRDTETQNCLAEIGQSIGFEVPKIGIRNLDRDRRMMPAGSKINLESQIQQRMHEEYVIGFYKPLAGN
ncbi:MAG: hypothetical protein HY326_14135 [Chloroflexi bacterium]|nr:hypothetical protein [Chloroflexota bacterium]